MKEYELMVKIRMEDGLLITAMQERGSYRRVMLELVRWVANSTIYDGQDYTIRLTRHAYQKQSVSRQA